MMSGNPLFPHRCWRAYMTGSARVPAQAEYFQRTCTLFAGRFGESCVECTLEPMCPAQQCKNRSPLRIGRRRHRYLTPSRPSPARQCMPPPRASRKAVWSEFYRGGGRALRGSYPCPCSRGFQSVTCGARFFSICARVPVWWRRCTGQPCATLTACAVRNAWS